ncbi:farnesyl-diphosphate farnesyltransferase [Paenibacillus cellulosilyticus]|uniref:Farnesyl-diphosphate farnesyltransferase n=2 Tax=Paenibacillus cellulosilyticus TaxID=375489 RepID=A0A2V2YPG5_9BACL|nr:farnesyl-diphosphate farnesyltransferase [Paenibacillus cellulosilyticus]
MEGFVITNVVLNDAMTMLEQTSRTFYIPISRLVPGLKEAVTSGYLCMRAIDEIEDHEQLSDGLKSSLLSGVRDALRTEQPFEAITKLFAPHQSELPAVTLQLNDWLHLCPTTALPIVKRYTEQMSDQMAEWVHTGWDIRTEEDLDRYTYSVAGMVGEMLSELWQWYDGTASDMNKAVAFGRGLQAVNIMRNRDEDLKRGVDFFPDGWNLKDMLQYTKRNLKLADDYIAELKDGPAMSFCKIPLALAHATTKLLSVGGNKLTRAAVLKIVGSLS